MDTIYDIDDVIYVPAKIERVVKTSDGRIWYRLRTDDGGYQIDASEEKVLKEYVTIPDDHWCLSKGGILAYKAATDEHYQIALKDGNLFFGEWAGNGLLKGLDSEEDK